MELAATCGPTGHAIALALFIGVPELLAPEQPPVVGGTHIPKEEGVLPVRPVVETDVR